MSITINKNNCTGCGICARKCPANAITIVDGCACIDRHACILCGTCETHCPAKAIDFKKPTTTPSTDLNDHAHIWVICEIQENRIHPVSLQLLSHARKLAEQSPQDMNVIAIILRHADPHILRLPFHYGADRIIVADTLLEGSFIDDVYANALIYLIQKYQPSIVLAGATPRGRSFMPRVSAHIHTGLTADCTDLSITIHGHLLQTRPAFGGNIMADILCTRHRPQMATVRPNIFPMQIIDDKRTGDIIDEIVPHSLLAGKFRIMARNPMQSALSNIADAKIVIGIGAGIGCKDNIATIEAMAHTCHAQIAGSRFIIDRGWLPYAQQVGQTGHTISPDLYVAIGISGAVQHLVGIKTAKKILAINSDARAPIFQIADIGLIGKWESILPDLNQIVVSLLQK